MVIKDLKKKTMVFLKSNKYIVIILLAGLALLCMPKFSDTDDIDSVEQNTPVIPEESISSELANILSKVKGAGEVEVLLTVATGEQILYQTDEERSESTDSTSLRLETVIITSDQKNEAGLIKQTIAPTYKGAIVICQGADDPSVCLQIVSAVSKATGLGADKISVLKMK